jgi:hypothetical protein
MTLVAIMQEKIRNTYCSLNCLRNAYARRDGSDIARSARYHFSFSLLYIGLSLPMAWVVLNGLNYID